MIVFQISKSVHKYASSCICSILIIFRFGDRCCTFFSPDCINRTYSITSVTDFCKLCINKVFVVTENSILQKRYDLNYSCCLKMYQIMRFLWAFLSNCLLKLTSFNSLQISVITILTLWKNKLVSKVFVSIV